MISVEKAEQLILQNSSVFTSVTCPLTSAIGHVLREDIHTDREQPPFHRVAMDGIAIQYSAWKNGRTSFVVAGMQKAGSPPLFLENAQSCIEVMTGAVLPKGCDCVVRYEDIHVDHGHAEVFPHVDLKPRQNIHQKASDYQKGERILGKGQRILAPQIAVLASVGKSEVLVDKRPVISVISTGDELVEVHEQPEPYQIRQSNTYALQTALQNFGYDKATRYHVNDDKAQLLGCLGNALSSSDILIMTGGVSMGKFDFVPEVMKELGIDVLFHKVKQRPGKPFWFGKSSGNKVVFALPGNPNAAMICFYRYVLPQLCRSSGEMLLHRKYARLSTDIRFNKALTYFLPVKLRFNSEDETWAHSVTINGSGDYGALGNSDGFVELEADTDHFPSGMAVPLYPWQF